MLGRGPWACFLNHGPRSHQFWLYVHIHCYHTRALNRFIHTCLYNSWGFPGFSVGNKSTCNAGDPVLIPGSGRSLGEGLGHPLQDSWASPVAQMVKNLPAMWETWVWSLGWEDPLEEGMATHSSILAWRIPCTEEPGGLVSIASQSVGYNWATKHNIYTVDSYQGGGLGCWPVQPKICM